MRWKKTDFPAVSKQRHAHRSFQKLRLQRLVKDRRDVAVFVQRNEVPLVFKRPRGAGQPRFLCIRRFGGRNAVQRKSVRGDFGGENNLAVPV